MSLFPLPGGWEFAGELGLLVVTWVVILRVARTIRSEETNLTVLARPLRWGSRIGIALPPLVLLSLTVQVVQPVLPDVAVVVLLLFVSSLECLWLAVSLGAWGWGIVAWVRQLTPK